MRQLIKFWSLTGPEKKFFCEASILLWLSNTCVKSIPVKHVERFLRTQWTDTHGGSDREQEIKLVRRSISRAADVLPWKSLCLGRSIAEFIMLRRRGIPAVLFTGVRFCGPSSLDAHAWVDTRPGVNDMSSDNSHFTTVIRIH
jgi:hypothetical protein